MPPLLFTGLEPTTGIVEQAGVVAGQAFTATVLADAEDIAAVTFFANTLELGNGPFEGGEMAFGSTLKATASAEVTIAKPGVYSFMARYTNKDETVGWPNLFRSSSPSKCFRMRPTQHFLKNRRRRACRLANIKTCSLIC